MRMQKVAARYRAKYPLTPLPPKGGCYLVPSSSGGKPFSLPLVWYPSTACRWSASGGCTMCNFGASQDNLPQATVMAETDAVLDRLSSGLQGIFFAPGGSFFNKSELALETRHALSVSLKRFPFLRMVGVETRPSYIKHDMLMSFVETLPATVQYFVVGMGLESITPAVREVAVNKGNDLPAIRTAIDAIHKANETSTVRIGFELYVLLKPPLMSEGEAIDDAVTSIEWAIAQGADTVGLFVNVVKDNTLCYHLSQQTNEDFPFRYRPAWWYSAFEVLRRLTPESAGRVQVLGPTSEIKGVMGPRSCDLCGEFLSGTITAWNYYRDQNLLDQVEFYTCTCKDEWMKEVNAEVEPFEDRLPSYLTKLENCEF